MDNQDKYEAEKVSDGIRGKLPRKTPVKNSNTTVNRPAGKIPAKKEPAGSRPPQRRPSEKSLQKNGSPVQHNPAQKRPNSHNVAHNNSGSNNGIHKKEAVTKKTGKKKIKNIIYRVCFVVCFITFCVCAVILVTYIADCIKSEKKVDKLKEYIDTEEPSIPDDNTATSQNATSGTDFQLINGVAVQEKFAKLYSMNSDFVGWITIVGTDIDYPVMQSMYDEEFYLHKDFDKEYTKGGTLFIDTSSDVKKPSDNILIYGHNMTTGKMFHSLFEYEDEEFYENHKYITFNTIYGDGEYEIIAAFRTNIYPVDYTGFKYYEFFDAATEEEFDNYVNNCKSLTPYSTTATAEYGDKLISLSTCAYHSENGRYVVVAKKINNDSEE